MEYPYQRISSWVVDHREEMLQLLERLVRLESPSEDRGSQRPGLEVIGRFLEPIDYRVTLTTETPRYGGHLYARPVHRPGRQFQLIVGHADTVWPLGTLRTMPFEIKHNTVRGPGVYDMKGGLVQGLFALKALHALQIRPQLEPLVFVNTDEEVGSPDSTRYVRMLGRRVCRAFVLEPALGLNGALKTARKGGGRFLVHVLGRSAHAGLQPQEGASAILELSHVIQQLHELNDPDRGITVNVGQIAGGIGPNVVAPSCQAVVDVRIRHPEDGPIVERAIYHLRTTTPGTRLAIEGHITRPPMIPTPRNEALWRAVRRLGDTLGLSLQESLAGGASDGNTLSQYTATLDGLGAVGDGAHAPHESIYIDRMLERTALLASLLLMPGGPSSSPEHLAVSRKRALKKPS